MKCPSCDEHFRGSVCECGFTVKGYSGHSTKGGNQRPNRRPITLSGQTFMLNQCAKQGCQNDGTMSHSTGHADSDDVNWYCGEHFMNRI